MFGRIEIINNEEQKSSAKPTYNAICVYSEFGTYETLMLTENELVRVRARAEKNPEDRIRVSPLARFVLAVLRGLRIL
jgi:hypothetical protein